MDEDEGLTFAADSKMEYFWVFFTHSVDHIYLLQSLSDSIFVLCVTGHIGRPELRKQSKTLCQGTWNSCKSIQLSLFMELEFEALSQVFSWVKLKNQLYIIWELDFY